MLRDRNNIVETDMTVQFERGGLLLLLPPDLFVRRTSHTKCNNVIFSAIKGPMTKPEHAPTLQRHRRVLSLYLI